MLISTDDLEI